MNAPNLFISVPDARAYASYCWFCGRVGVAPWTLEQFLLLTDREVVRGWDRFQIHLTSKLDKQIAEVIPQRRYSKSKIIENDLIANAKAVGFTIGVLRTDGTVHPVRPQTDPNSGEGTPSPIRSRYCKKCGCLKLGHCFGTKRGTVREVCKLCDSKLRVARRRNKNALQVAVAA